MVRDKGRLQVVGVREDFDETLNRGVSTCSGHEYNEMGCSCLLSAYHRQMSCSEDLTYKSNNCATYNHYCTTKPAGKREKHCCKAVLCFLERLGC
ncbi:hypothetical protein ACHWQZ_G014584 [Mnemiopsis leidyi]